MHNLRTPGTIGPVLLGPVLLGLGGLGPVPGGICSRSEPGVTPLSTRKNKNPSRLK